MASRARSSQTSIEPSPVTTTSPTTKENDGRARQRCRRQWLLRVLLSLSVFLISYQLLWTYWLAGVFVPEYEVDDMGRKRYRRHPEQLYKMDKTNNKKVPT